MENLEDGPGQSGDEFQVGLTEDGHIWLSAGGLEVVLTAGDAKLVGETLIHLAAESGE